jgi:hypothetical protein
MGKRKKQAINLLLLPSMDIIREVSNKFVYVSFQHVFRELNEKVDKISKESLLLQEGLLVIFETSGGCSLLEEVMSLY